MHIGSGLNTVSSMYRQQKGNNMKTPASGEKTFYTAETPKVYQIFTTDNMLWTGGNGTGLSYCLKYADDSTDENPVVLAKGVDENGKEFEQRIYINDVNPSSATVVEMRALEAHYKVEKQGGFTSLPLEAGNMGLNDRRDFGIHAAKCRWDNDYCSTFKGGICPVYRGNYGCYVLSGCRHFQRFYGQWYEI